MRGSLVIALVLLLVMPATAVAAKAPRGAVRAAERHAQTALDLPQRPRSEYSLRSKRKPSWALVTGRGSDGLWAAWVQRTSRGRWKVRYFRTRGTFMPGRRVPCDIKPAFSEPSC